MVYSDKVPATPGATDKQTPAPWVPFTRAGCTVGDFSTANMVLENVPRDLPAVFGPNSPEVAQSNADPDSFKDAEIADYIGEAVHCAKGDTICANAQAVKFGQTTPSPSAVADSLPTEPGGYDGFQGLFGAKYVAPQLGAGTANVTHNGFQVTNAAGNLVDLNGNEIQEPFSHKPGFAGFNPTATQSLAYLADMQEAGIPVTYGYISDLHERKADTGTLACTTVTATARRQAGRAGRQLLHQERRQLRRRLREVLPAPGRRRHYSRQHRVRHRRRGERPVRRRQRRARHRADPGRLQRQRHHPVQLRIGPDR